MAVCPLHTTVHGACIVFMHASVVCLIFIWLPVHSTLQSTALVLFLCMQVLFVWYSYGCLSTPHYSPQPLYYFYACKCCLFDIHMAVCPLHTTVHSACIVFMHASVVCLIFIWLSVHSTLQSTALVLFVCMQVLFVWYSYGCLSTPHYSPQPLYYFYACKCCLFDIHMAVCPLHTTVHNPCIIFMHASVVCLIFIWLSVHSTLQSTALVLFVCMQVLFVWYSYGCLSTPHYSPWCLYCFYACKCCLFGIHMAVCPLHTTVHGACIVFMHASVVCLIFIWLSVHSTLQSTVLVLFVCMQVLFVWYSYGCLSTPHYSPQCLYCFYACKCCLFDIHMAVCPLHTTVHSPCIIFMHASVVCLVFIWLSVHSTVHSACIVFMHASVVCLVFIWLSVHSTLQSTALVLFLCMQVLFV